MLAWDFRKENVKAILPNFSTPEALITKFYPLPSVSAGVADPVGVDNDPDLTQGKQPDLNTI